MRYTKKIDIVEAYLWTGLSIEAARDFVKENNLDRSITMGSKGGLAGLVVPVPFGAILVRHNSYLIKGSNGIYSSMSKDSFEKDYSILKE